ncbi:MAG: TlpA disulfide reductase family protein [Bacteroidota bacterium]
MRALSFLLLLATMAGCNRQPAELKTGTWRGVISLQNQELPFQFDVEKTNGQYRAYLRNASEKILLDEITLTGDSVSLQLHVFDAALKAKIDNNTLSGTFVKNYAPEDNLPFRAAFGEDYRYAPPGEATTDFTGKYQVEFVTGEDTYPSVGFFEQTGNQVTGSFLTPTGDYRYLEGNVVDGRLWLSTFDGNHAFVFTATLQGDSLKGDFYSGKTSHETFRGIKNENATMPAADTLTYLKPGYEKLAFSFPDLNGEPVTLEDERFRNKVVVLQIFGTWCPNCMDETRFLTTWYQQNKERGVEILGLAYERKDDFAYASDRVKKMKAKWNVGYDFVIAGVNDKAKAAETLPALNHVLAFPTTIFVGKDGKVKKIHTGFSGPGTGVYYEQFVQQFNDTINELLAEEIALK